MTFRVYFDITKEWQDRPLELGGAIMAYVNHEVGKMPECNYWKEGGRTTVYLRYRNEPDAIEAYGAVRWNANKGPFGKIELKEGSSTHRRIAYPTSNPYKDRIIELSGAAVISWVESQPLRRRSCELSEALDHLGFLKEGKIPPAI